jgi:galactokinase
MSNLLSLHRAEYGVEPEIVASAPGSVNLMGEHTDYNDGFILQAALEMSVEVGISLRKDNSLRFYAADLSERKRTTIANLKYKREDRWANYPKGVIYEIAQLGYALKGMDITIKGSVPQGIGLAASAALCIATAVAVNEILELDLNQMQIIQSSSLAEKAFIGLDTEITNHLISYVARKDNIVFLDSRTLKYEHIPLRMKKKQIIITDSNVPKGAVQGDLLERKEDCRACVEYMNRKKQGSALRDYSPSDLQSSMGTVPENIRRICMHVVEENERVLEARNAIKSGKFEAYGKLLSRSHESLRDLYEVSCPEVDWLVKRACEIPGVLGSRLTGSGFGGCTITLIEEDALDTYQEKLDEYERIFGFTAETFICTPSAGVRIVYP